MNPLRISYIREQLKKNNYKKIDDVSSSYHHHLPFRGLRMLDIGCGGGVLTEVWLIFNFDGFSVSINRSHRISLLNLFIFILVRH
jgi:hypothetical protein